MNYELIFDRKAIEFLETLPKELRKRIFILVFENKFNFLNTSLFS